MTQELRKLAERLKLRNENGSLGEITEGDQLQAAEAIEALTSAEAKMVEKTGYLSVDVLVDNYLIIRADIEALQGERDAYQQSADKMAAEHKVERDALAAELAGLKAQGPVAWVTVENGVCISTRSANFKHISDGQYQLYAGPLQIDVLEVNAAPKALAPEPLIKFRHGCKWCGKAKCAAGCHGIGGTP